MSDAHDQSPTLLDRVRQTCQRRQYSYHTETELGKVSPIDRADKPRHLPTVLSRDEVRRLFDAMSAGPNRLIAHLFYGSGLRLSEALRLRVKEFDIDQNRIHVRDGEGGTDRTTVLPERLHNPLRRVPTHTM